MTSRTALAGPRGRGLSDARRRQPRGVRHIRRGHMVHRNAGPLKLSAHRDRRPERLRRGSRTRHGTYAPATRRPLRSWLRSERASGTSVPAPRQNFPKRHPQQLDKSSRAGTSRETPNHRTGRALHRRQRTNRPRHGLRVRSLPHHHAHHPNAGCIGVVADAVRRPRKHIPGLQTKPLRSIGRSIDERPTIARNGDAPRVVIRSGE